MFQKVVEFLSGKKFYIMVGVDALDAIGAHLGWWDADHIRQIVEGIFTAVFLRMAVKKSGPVV